MTSMFARRSMNANQSDPSFSGPSFFVFFWGGGRGGGGALFFFYRSGTSLRAGCQSLNARRSPISFLPS